MPVSQVGCNKSFGGLQKIFEHESKECSCKMKFGVYFPPQAETQKCPVLYFLSGLTCTEQNVVTKGSTQLFAAKYGIVIVAPDTSPRGCNIAGEDESYDFGSGAGFYVDATEEKWSKNYRMYSYVTKELPALINSEFADKVDGTRMSISGHSMGGHGALICSLKNPGLYKVNLYVCFIASKYFFMFLLHNLPVLLVADVLIASLLVLNLFYISLAFLFAIVS